MPDLLADIYQESCLTMEIPGSWEQYFETWDHQVLLDGVTGEWLPPEDSCRRYMDLVDLMGLGNGFPIPKHRECLESVCSLVGDCR